MSGQDVEATGKAETKPPVPSAMKGMMGVIFFLLMNAWVWTAWIIFLAGTAAGQKACLDALNAVTNPFGRKLLEKMDYLQQEAGQQASYTARRMLSETADLLSVDTTSHGRHLLVSNSETCSTRFSLPWWIVWFQFFCMVFIILLGVSAGARRNFKMSVLLMFAIETTLLMWLAGEVNTVIVESNGGKYQDKIKSAAGAQMAGCIMLMLFNLVYIFLSASAIELIPNFSDMSSETDKAPAAPPATAYTAPPHPAAYDAPRPYEEAAVPTTAVTLEAPVKGPSEEHPDGPPPAAK